MTSQPTLTTSQSNPLGLSWPLIFATLLCLGLLIQTTSEILIDGDTYWHLAAGHWIWAHHAVPVADPFSYTRLGMPWVDHEWLSQCILAKVFDYGGWTGLVLVAVVCCSLTLAYLMRFLLKRMQPIHSLLFTTLATAVLLGHLLVRPHVLTWPLLAVWVGTLIDGAERNRPPPWWLVGIMVLWANLHLSHILGLALTVPLALDAALASSPERRVAVIKRWGLFFALCTLAALLTPAGWKSVLPFTEIFTLKHLARVGEWRSANFGAVSPLEIWLMLLLGLAFTGYLRLPAVRILLILGLLHQALAHARFIAVFGLLAPMLLATGFGKQYEALNAGKQQAKGLDVLFARLVATARPWAIICCAVLIALTAYFTSQAGRHMPLASITPKAAVDAAIQAGAKGNVMNQYTFGGYLIFRGIPPFIDGRAEVYGNEIMDAYIDAVDSNRSEKIQNTLDTYKIDWTLLTPDSILVLYLNMRSDWEKIHEDEVAVVHVRRKKH